MQNLYTYCLLIIIIFFFTASIPFLICPIGLPLIGILTDKYGRRISLQITLIPMTLSWLLLAFADSYTTIIISRSLQGIPLGK